MEKIIEKDLDILVKRLNELTNSPLTTYTKQKEGNI